MEAENRVKVILGDIAKNLDLAVIRDEHFSNPTLWHAPRYFWKPSSRKGATELRFCTTIFCTALPFPSLAIPAEIPLLQQYDC